MPRCSGNEPATIGPALAQRIACYESAARRNPIGVICEETKLPPATCMHFLCQLVKDKLLVEEPDGTYRRTDCLTESNGKLQNHRIRSVPGRNRRWGTREGG
jgi:hypothetical protein